MLDDELNQVALAIQEVMERSPHRKIQVVVDPEMNGGYRIERSWQGSPTSIVLSPAVVRG